MKYLALFFLTTSAFAGNLQNADFATPAQITSAGGNPLTQLLQSSNMVDSVDGVLMNTQIGVWNAKQATIGSYTSPSHQWLVSYAAGVFTSSQPGFSDLSGIISASQMLALPSADIYVGNGSNQPVAQALSGDATLAANGAMALATVNSSPGTYSNATVTVNAKGLVTSASSGASGATPEQETPAGTPNGVLTAFTLAHSVSMASTLSLYLDGLILNQGVDYTVVIATGVITMSSPPQYGQTLYATYQH